MEIILASINIFRLMKEIISLKRSWMNDRKKVFANVEFELMKIIILS